MTTSELLRGVATFGLFGIAALELTEPLDDDAWTVLVGAVDRHRLVGLLHAAVAAGDMAVTDRQREELDELHLSWCVTSVELERELLVVIDHLERCGVESLVLKGAAHAHLLYPDPSWRSFGDNDVLVRGAQVEPAIDALEALGYRRTIPTLDPGFDARFGKGATLRRRDGVELDLHRTLLFGTYGLRVEPDLLFAGSVAFRLGGRELRALGSEMRVLHLCYHASLGDPDPRFASLRDAAQAATVTDVDLREVVALAERWRSTAALARTVMLWRARLGFEAPPVLAEAAAGFGPTSVDDAAVASYIGRDRSFVAKIRASLPFLDRRRDRVALVLAATRRGLRFVGSSRGGR